MAGLSGYYVLSAVSGLIQKIEIQAKKVLNWLPPLAPWDVDEKVFTQPDEPLVRGMYNQFEGLFVRGVFNQSEELLVRGVYNQSDGLFVLVVINQSDEPLVRGVYNHSDGLLVPWVINHSVSLLVLGVFNQPDEAVFSVVSADTICTMGTSANMSMTAM